MILSRFFHLTLFGMEFFMYSKSIGVFFLMGEQSKIFKNNAKKMKRTKKIKASQELFKISRKNVLPSIFFDDISTFLTARFKNEGSLLKFQTFV